MNSDTHSRFCNFCGRNTEHSTINTKKFYDKPFDRTAPWPSEGMWVFGRIYKCTRCEVTTKA